MLLISFRCIYSQNRTTPALYYVFEGKKKKQGKHTIERQNNTKLLVVAFVTHIMYISHYTHAKIVVIMFRSRNCRICWGINRKQMRKRVIMCTTKKDMSFVTDFPLHTYPGYVQQQFPPILHKTFARIFLTFYQKHSKLSQLSTPPDKVLQNLCFLLSFFLFVSCPAFSKQKHKSGILK